MDTNWFIAASNVRSALPELPIHSVITRIELYSDPTLDTAGLEFWNRILTESAEYGLTREIVLRAAELRRRFGGRLPDAVIAATGSVYRLPVLTRDRGMLRYASVVAFPALD